MSYGIKYTSEFSDILGGVNSLYTIHILQKGWSGNVKRFTVSNRPVQHLWQTDDPKTAIKGSALKVNMVAHGSLPLTTLYSNEDDFFKIRLYQGADLLFEGFLLQEDSSEDLAHWSHPMQLQATDNLGLLKDVPLNEAPITYVPIFSSQEDFILLNPHTMTVSNAFWANLAPGYRITISGGTTVDGVYTIASLLAGGTGTSFVFLNEVVQNSAGLENGTLLVEANNSFQQKMTLLSIIHSCLASTGLELALRIYSNLIETTQNPNVTFLAQTLIDSQAFLKDDKNYHDCYTVLTRILERFNLTLFQALGVWNIVRWDELRYYNNQIKGFSYDSNFLFQGNVALAGALLSGREQVTHEKTVLVQKILRAYKSVKETFNYKQPAQILRNYNLQELGALRSTVVSGAGTSLRTTKEYEFPWWVDNPVSVGTAVGFIRVIYDHLGNEIERYAVVKEDDLMSYRIEVNQGDTFAWSYRFRTNVSQAGPINLSLTVRLTDGVTTKYLREPTSVTPGWQNGPGWVYLIPTGENTNEWHTVEINADAAPIPFDGLLYVYLEMLTLVPSNETHFTDLRFTYTPLVNSSTKVIGHTHTDSQAGQIKNKKEVEVFMDSSPRNSIVGTLFLNTLTGLLQTRTDRWTRGHVAEAKRLGEITTFETMFWRRTARMILEGTLKTTEDTVSMLDVFTHAWYPGRFFGWGNLEIDYRHKELTGTLWELWQDGELDADLVHEYLFNYLYDLK